jgi:hypothetical protein
LLQSVDAAAVEREELLGKQCGKAVGTDGDVEARLGAGDHDPDREVPRLGFIQVAFFSCSGLGLSVLPKHGFGGWERGLLLCERCEEATRRRRR